VNLLVGGTTQGNILVIILFSALADVLYIFPFKADKKTFDENKDELGFSSKIKVAKYKKTKEDLERERVQKLADEARAIKGNLILNLTLI
jgi:hypothetical protein